MKQKDDCLSSGKIAGKFKTILYDFDSNKITFSDLKQKLSIILNKFCNTLPKQCGKCADCLNFTYYTNLLSKIVEDNGKKKGLSENLHSWEKNCNADNILNSTTIERTKIPLFNPFSRDKSLIIYCDFNVFDIVERGKQIPKIESEKEIFHFYSPIHLEETYRMKHNDKMKKRIETIKEITKNNLILNVNDKLGFYIEDPIESFRIAKSNTKVNYFLEERRILQKKDQKIFWDNISGGNFGIKTGNSKNIFNEITESQLNSLLLNSGYLKTFSDFKLNSASFSELGNIIHSLYNVLDNLGYKKDQDEKKIRSSLYDVEHLKYASCSDIFVTLDKKLMKRAEQIYSFLKIKTKIYKTNKL